MVLTPQFLGPDGVLREKYIFSTDLSSRFFTGTMDSDTVDMQVSIRGAAFSSSPNLILFEGSSFTIPNPSAFPDGLQLLAGDNAIEVRSILSNGTTTAPGSILARLSLDRDVKAGVLPPSAISVERQDLTVQVSVDGLDDTNVVGYNFYASVYPGGGVSGYSLLNTAMVITGSSVERENASLGELTVDAEVAVDQDGSHAADPMYLRVIGTQEDRDGNVIQTDFNQRLVIPETTSKMKTSFDVEDLETVDRYSFVHDRRSNQTSSTNPAIPNSAFNAIPSTDPLYYVVTAVYLIDNVEYESVYSPEVTASPVIVSTSINQLPSVSRQQIVRDTTLSIFRSHPDLKVESGAVLRDTFINPFSTEAERMRFIIGYIQAAQAFSTLLEIDDPTSSGVSISVAQSAYKQALKQAFYLRADLDVQNLINNAFDHLASKYNTIRRSGQRSRGEVSFYTTTRPQTTKTMSLGSPVLAGGIRYRTTSAAEITATGVGSTYNPTTGRYVARAFVQAEDPGSAGDVARGQINVLENPPSGVSVTNESDTFGGKDAESNLELAVRASNAISSVDSGTAQGYVQTVQNTSGVLETQIVEAGDDLMQRDWNTILQAHLGGKVDIWVRGESPATLTDSFAFSFELVKNGQFEPVGQLANLKFRAVNAAISDSNPLIEMLDNEAWGFQFEDATTGHVFDLTDVTLIPPDGIQLSTAHNAPLNISITDAFRGSYRYRTSDKQILSRQPANAILSVQGDSDRSGTLASSLYKLFAGSPPLILGRSSEAGNYLQIIQSANGTDTIPSGNPITVTGENHVLTSDIEYLLNLGINPITVRIYSVDRSVEYYGPYAPNVTADFTLIDESGETPLGFQLTAASRMSEGETVIVDYSHDENFVVEYTANALVTAAQNQVESMRHVTADVLVKEAVEVGVDIFSTIVLEKGKNIQTVDGSIRTALSRFFGAMKMGIPVRESDIIHELDAVDGVSYVVVPLAHLAKADGSQVVREEVATDLSADFTKITAWSTNTVDMYLVEDPLTSGTIDGGGESNDSRGVFLDELQFSIYDEAPNSNGVPLKNGSYRAFIIGNGGLNIPGYSDDATLAVAYPFATAAEIEDKREELTRRRVIMALPTGVLPSSGAVTVTYVVYGDDGVQAVDPGPVGYLVLGDLEFTYDEEV